MSDATGGGAPREVRPILTFPARLRLRVLSDDDVHRLHAAAVELLGGEGTATVAAAGSAPRSIVLGGRVPEHDVLLDGARCLLGTGGPAPRVRPREGGDPVPATDADLDELVRLGDALPEVAVLCGPPVRVAGQTALGELASCLGGTSKHVQIATLRTAAEAEAAVRMTLAVAGSEAGLRSRPPLSLSGGPDALAAALVFARAGLPVGTVAAADAHDAVAAGLAAPDGSASPGVAAGKAAARDASASTAPPDVAAALVRHHAAVLAACAAVQTAAPGAPFFYLAHPPLAGLPACGPQAVLFLIAAIQLAAHVGLPVCASGMGTGSHEPDWQACTQNALGSLSTAAAAAGLTTGAGTLGAGTACSAQQLVMDAELFSWNGRLAAGIGVDDETLAVETIERVGIGGNYLGQRHTRRHMRDIWRPRLLDRSAWDAWVASGREGAYEKATTLAASLLSEHRAAPLDEGVEVTLRRVMEEAGSVLF